jgi:hypothetical protein
MTNGRRIEVITSVERRRRWSAAEKQQVVAATLEPGASVSAVAREAGIHPGQLYGWRRQLRICYAPSRLCWPLFVPRLGRAYHVAELPVISGDKSYRTVANAFVSRTGAHDRRNYAEYSLEV